LQLAAEKRLKSHLRTRALPRTAKSSRAGSVFTLETVMKRTLFVGLAISALFLAAPLGAASAADMPVKAPAPPPAPAFDWNGFYVGVYAGAAWMDQATTTDPCGVAFTALCNALGTGNFNGVPPATYDMGSSFTGGGTIGYNWQPTPYTLIGLENDFGYLHLKGSAIQNPPPFGRVDTVASTKIGDWYDAYTARIGAVDGHAMFYVKGGGVSVKYASGVVDSNAAGTTINATTSKTLTGWTAGGGIEYGIDLHWSVKAEYSVLGIARNVTSCGTAFLFGVTPLATLCTTTHSPDVQLITVGLNYRFR
jgi:outer membrane immunogenic protein